jgi:LysM repeat protein
MNRWRGFLLCVLVVYLAIAASQPTLAAPDLPRIAHADTTYIVQPGDSLTRIAARYGLSISQLAAANGLGTTAWVYSGQRLTIPTASQQPGGAPATTGPTPSGSTYVVQRGDTLMSIAARHGVSVSQLATLNGLYWNAWVYVGQQLAIPDSQPAPAPSTPPVSGGQVYVVRAGDTLFSIARAHGTTVSALSAANGLATHTIYVGQRLKIPAGGAVPIQPPVSPPAVDPGVGASGGKWIGINLTQQTITAYVGQTPVRSAIVSTGLPRTPTVVGTFSVYVKYLSTPMSGPGYYLPNVPHTMYFYRGYAIHGAYWHNNFGTPMSHGCVNLSLPDAEWFYNWTPVGTKVVVHY